MWSGIAGRLVAWRNTAYTPMAPNVTARIAEVRWRRMASHAGEAGRGGVAAAAIQRRRVCERGPERWRLVRAVLIGLDDESGRAMTGRLEWREKRRHPVCFARRYSLGATPLERQQETVHRDVLVVDRIAWEAPAQGSRDRSASAPGGNALVLDTGGGRLGRRLTPSEGCVRMPRGRDATRAPRKPLASCPCRHFDGECAGVATRVRMTSADPRPESPVRRPSRHRSSMSRRPARRSRNARTSRHCCSGCGCPSLGSQLGGGQQQRETPLGRSLVQLPPDAEQQLRLPGRLGEELAHPEPHGRNPRRHIVVRREEDQGNVLCLGGGAKRRADLETVHDRHHARPPRPRRSTPRRRA